MTRTAAQSKIYHIVNATHGSREDGIAPTDGMEFSSPSCRRRARRDRAPAAVHSRSGCARQACAAGCYRRTGVGVVETDREGEGAAGYLNAPDPDTFQEDARFALDTLQGLTTRPDQIKHLRQTILNLAVVGKLSDNRISTTGALSELRAVESKKRELALRKPKTIPEVSSEEHWCELPEGWLWVRWDQISDWITYGFTRPMPHVKDGIPIITGKNVNGKIIFEAAHRTSQEAYEVLSEMDRPTRGDIQRNQDSWQKPKA